MRFLRVFVLTLLIPCAAFADPILLADYHPSPSSGHSGSHESRFDIRWFASPSPPEDPVISLFGDGDSDTFGFRIPAGTTGTFDFTAANAAGFDALSARLTDSSDDHLVFTFNSLNLNDRIPNGETSAFGDLLTDHDIDFFRLVIAQNDHTLDARWELWGQSPTSVPVSGTLTLLGIGLAIVALSRRRYSG